MPTDEMPAAANSWFFFTRTQNGNIHFVFASLFLLCARLLVLLPKERCKVICGGVFTLPFVFALILCGCSCRPLA